MYFFYAYYFDLIANNNHIYYSVMEFCAMKIFKLFLVLSVVITIGYFSWSYFTGRLLQKEHERGTLVFEDCSNSAKVSYAERIYVYE